MHQQSTTSLPRWPTVLAAMLMLCAIGLIAHAGVPSRPDLLIRGLNDQPQLTGIPDTVYISALSHAGFTADANDDGEPPQISAIGLPPFASFVDNGDGTATLSAMCTFSDSGSYDVTIIADDGHLTDSAHVVLCVLTPPDHPPCWLDLADTIWATVAVPITIDFHPFDLDSLPLRVTSIGLPSFVTIYDVRDNRNTFRFTCSAAEGQQGTYSFQLILTDAILADTNTVSLIVRATCSPEWIALPEFFQAPINETTKYLLTARDCAGNPVALHGDVIPAFATFVDQGNGTALLTLNPSPADAGTTILKATAANGPYTTSFQRDVIVVYANSTRPSWVDVPDTIIVPTNTKPSFVWHAIDEGGEPLTMTILGLPAFVTWFQGTNTARVFPKPAFADTGTYVFRLIASDGYLADTTKVVMVVPVPLNFPPVWVDAPDTIVAVVGEVSNVIVTAFDSNLTTPSLSLTPLSAEIGFTDRGDGSGVVTTAFAHAPATATTVQLTASDGVNSTVHSMTIRVVEQVPVDTLTTGDFITTQMFRYETGLNVDQLRLEDLDGDGLEEVLCRVYPANVYDADLRVLSLADSSAWDLPAVPGGLRAYSVRSGTAGLEPIVWTFNGQVMTLSTDRTSWDTWMTMPDSIAKFEWRETLSGEEQLVVAVDQSSSERWTDIMGCTYSTTYEQADLRTLTPEAYQGHWPLLANKTGTGNARFDFVQVFDAGELVDLLIPRYDHYTHYGLSGWPNCSPMSDRFYTNYALYFLGLDDEGPALLDWFFADDYMHLLPNPYATYYFIGRGRWHEPGNDAIHMAWVSNIPPFYPSWNYKWRITIASYDDGWTIQDHEFNLLAQPTTGGLITLGDDHTEFMLIIVPGSPGYLLSMDDASRVGRVKLQHGNQWFASGYVRDIEHRDLTYIDDGAIEVQRVVRDPDSHTLPAVIHVPTDAPSIAAAIAQAYEGDTILVSPGEYWETPLNNDEKTLTIISEGGPAVTTIHPQSPTQTLWTFRSTLGRITLSGFSVTGSSSLVCIAIQDCADVQIDNNNFKNNPVANLVIESRASTVTCRRNLFFGNGGISCIGAYSDLVTIVNNTFAGNNRGYLSTSECVFSRNNIVVNSKDYGLYGWSLSADYNLVWNNHPDYESNVIPGVHDLSTDPLFVDPANGDYHLQPSSPCIDAGDPSAIFNDPDGSRADIGAYPLTGSVPQVQDANGDGVVDLLDAVLRFEQEDRSGASRILETLFR